MGRGLVEPVDDLRDTNPATHPELLHALAADFIAHGYNLCHTLKMIATSAAYARASAPVAGNEADDRFYSHALARPLGPEVLADALGDVTGLSEDYGASGSHIRAVSLADPRATSESLEVLGRCPRPGQAGCTERDAAAGGLAVKLHLLNGALINRKLAASEGRLKRRLAEGAPADAVIDEFYFRALSRTPRESERNVWALALHQADSPAERQAVVEDVVWALLNSREFQTTH